MAQYHPDRRKIRDTFEIPLNSQNEKLECAIFQKWLDADQGGVVRCGLTENIEITVTVGLSESLTTTIEGSLSFSMGPKHLSTIKAAIKSSLGREINWSQTTTTKRSFALTAPKCGLCELTTYQLCREYEFRYFRRGGWLFSNKHWDLKWTETIVEKTSTFDGMHDVQGYSELCSGCAKRPPLEYDGRLCLDFGSFSMRVPYRAEGDGSLKMLLAGKALRVALSDERNLNGTVITLAPGIIPPVMLFLGGVSEPVNGLEATIFEQRDVPATEDAEFRGRILAEIQPVAEIARSPAEQGDQELLDEYP